MDTNLQTLQINNKSNNITNKQSSLFSDLFSFDNKSQQLNQQFSIDIDPFSSSSSTNSSFSKNNNNNKTIKTDPFGIGLTNDTKPIDPFTIFDNFTKMSDPTETVNQLDETTQEQNDQETPSFQISYHDPIEDEQYNDDEDIGNAFLTYSNSDQVNLSDESKLDEMALISNELAESKLKLTEILEEDEDLSERQQTNVVDRVISDSDSDDLIDERNDESNKFSIDNLKIGQQNSEDEDGDSNSNKDNNQQVQSTLSAASPDSMDKIKLTVKLYYKYIFTRSICCLM